MCTLSITAPSRREWIEKSARLQKTPHESAKNNYEGPTSRMTCLNGEHDKHNIASLFCPSDAWRKKIYELRNMKGKMHEGMNAQNNNYNDDGKFHAPPVWPHLSPPVPCSCLSLFYPSLMIIFPSHLFTYTYTPLHPHTLPCPSPHHPHTCSIT